MREINYIVTITKSFWKVQYKFNSIEDASKFMSAAALHVVNDGDDITITMKLEITEKERKKINESI